MAHFIERLHLADGARELAGARLQLGQQARVLDRDGDLVGEGLYEGDLAVGEGSHLVPIDEDDAEQREVIAREAVDLLGAAGGADGFTGADHVLGAGIVTDDLQ